MEENSTAVETKYTPKKIRNTLFVVGIITAVLVSAFACVRMYERDMHYWESIYKTEGF